MGDNAAPTRAKTVTVAGARAQHRRPIFAARPTSTSTGSGSSRSNSGALKVLAVLGAGGVLATVGTYASFTSTIAESQSFTAGTVTIAFVGAGGTATNRLTVGASGLVPGDTVQRAVDVVNSGNQDFASVDLTTSATTSSLLDTDGTNGLQMVVDKCSVAWTEAGVAPAYTYTCSGTTSSVIASQPVIGTNVTMNNLAMLTAGATDHLRVTMTVPATADNTFQSANSVILYTFTATQRAGTAH